MSDFSEIDAFASELSSVQVRDRVRQIVKRGAVNIKKDAMGRVRSQHDSRYTKHYARSITFDIKDGGLAAEIGPEMGRTQAFLGKILEFGTATSPATPHLIPAFDAELPNFYRFLSRVGVDALRGGGR